MDKKDLDQVLQEAPDPEDDEMHLWTFRGRIKIELDDGEGYEAVLAVIKVSSTQTQLSLPICP